MPGVCKHELTFAYAPGLFVARTTEKSRDWSPVRKRIALSAPRMPSLMPPPRRPRKASASSMNSRRPCDNHARILHTSQEHSTSSRPAGATISVLCCKCKMQQ